MSEHQQDDSTKVQAFSADLHPTFFIPFYMVNVQLTKSRSIALDIETCVCNLCENSINGFRTFPAGFWDFFPDEVLAVQGDTSLLKGISQVDLSAIVSIG